MRPSSWSWRICPRETQSSLDVVRLGHVQGRQRIVWVARARPPRCAISK